MVNKRLSSISCNEQVFKEASPVYQAALNNSGYTQTPIQSKHQQQIKRRSREKEILHTSTPRITQPAQKI